MSTVGFLDDVRDMEENEEIGTFRRNHLYYWHSQRDACLSSRNEGGQ